MKTKMFRSFFLWGFVAFACWIVSCSRKKDAGPNQGDPYYVSVPINKLSSIQSPCIDACIGNLIFSMEIDLGFSGDLTLENRYIEQIAPLSFLKSKPMYGVRGKKYATNLYSGPKVKIGDMSFYDCVLQEHSPLFNKHSVFVESGEEPSPREPGRLGWEIFHTVNLLIDLENSRIAFADSLATLKQCGYSTEKFVEVPLCLERGLIELIANIPGKSLRCLLDTGCTLNILHDDLSEEKTERALFDPEYISEISSFKMNGVDFGHQKFRRFPIDLPIAVDAVLGVEFFKKYVVFLDFRKKKAYFSKYESNSL